MSLYLSLLVIFATPISSSAKVLHELCNRLFGKSEAPLEVASVSPQSWPAQFDVSRYGVSSVYYSVDSPRGQRDVSLIKELEDLEFHTLHGYSVAFIHQHCKVYNDGQEPTRCILVRNSSGKLLGFIIKALGHDDSWFILHIAVNMDAVGKDVLSAMIKSDDFRGLRIHTELHYATSGKSSDAAPQERFVQLLREVGYNVETYVPWRKIIATP